VTKPYKENKITHQSDYSFADEIAEKGLETIPELMHVLSSNAIRKIFLCWQVIRLLKNDGYSCSEYPKKGRVFSEWSKSV